MRRRARADGRPDVRGGRDRSVRTRPLGARANRRAVQQRRDLADRRRLGARHHARGLRARPGDEPAQRVPVLQARHPPPAGGRRRVGDQHRLVRGGDGLGHLPDRLHGIQGRRARALARAGRAVRQTRRARQRAVPRPGRHPAAARALCRRSRRGPAADGPRPDGPLRAGRRDRQRRAVPRLRRVLVTSTRRPSSSTAESAGPTRPRCDDGRSIELRRAGLRRQAARVSRAAAAPGRPAATSSSGRTGTRPPARAGHGSPSRRG